MKLTNMRNHIHQSNLIEGYDDPDFDKQSMVAWQRLLEVKHLTRYDVLKTQKIITLLQTDLQPWWRGYYRDLSNQRVWVGGREGLEPAKVPAAMDAWLDGIELKPPKFSHIEFEHIHPFVDGNGRTGRMLMWWQEIQQGKEPTLITFNNRREYYDWF